MMQTRLASFLALTWRSTVMPQPSGSIRSSRIHAGGLESASIASATVAASDTAKSSRLSSLAIAVRAALSSSTISTDRFDDDFEAAPVSARPRKPNVGSDVTSERLADREPHSESFATVSLIIVHLVELVEQVLDVRFRYSDPGVRNAHGDFFIL